MHHKISSVEFTDISRKILTTIFTNLITCFSVYNFVLPFRYSLDIFKSISIITGILFKGISVIPNPVLPESICSQYNFIKLF